MIVSNGTLRPQDLIPAFIEALESLGPAAKTRVAIIRLAYSELLSWLRVTDEIPSPLWPRMTELLHEDLFPALDEFAPEGTYFGSEEGNGSCFGFFPLDVPESQRNTFACVW